MAIGKITELFLMKHLEEAGEDFISLTKNHEDEPFKKALVDAIHHAQLMLVCMAAGEVDYDGEKYKILEWCVEHSPINKSLGDCVAISLELDKIIEDNYTMKEYVFFIRRELRWE